MTKAKLLWTIPAATLLGCVYSHQPGAYGARTTVATPAETAVVVPKPPPTPTSVGSDIRVYPEPRLSVTTPVAPPVKTATLPGVIATSDPRDVTITEQVRHMLEADTTRIYRNVDFAIDHGKVTLRGTVAGDVDRIALQNRLSTMPGVLAVDNRLDVEFR